MKDGNKHQKESNHKIYFIYTTKKIEKEFHFIMDSHSNCKYDCFDIYEIQYKNNEYLIQCFNSVIEQYQRKIKFILKTDKQQEYETKEFEIDPNENNFLYNIEFNRTIIYKVWKYPPDVCPLSEYQQLHAFLTYFHINDQKFCKQRLFFNTIQMIEQSKKRIDEQLFLLLYECVIQENDAVKLFKYLSIDSYLQSDKITQKNYNKMFKSLLYSSSFRTKFKNQDKSINLDLAELCYNYCCSEGNFLNSLQKLKPAISNFIGKIIKYKVKSLSLGLKELEILFAYIKNESTLEDLFALTNGNIVINYVINNKKLLHESFYKSKQLELAKYITPDISNNLETILQILSRCDSKTNIPFLSTNGFKKLLNQHINLYDKNSFEKLLLIKKFIKTNKGYSDLTSSINKAFHFTGILFVEQQKFKNLEILAFILEDECLDLNNDESASIGFAIKLEEIDDEQIKIIHKINFINRINQQKLPLFLKGLFSTITQLKSFSVIFKLFPSKSPNKQLALEAKRILIELIHKDADQSKLDDNIQLLVKYMNHEKLLQEFRQLIQDLEQNMPQNQYIDLILKIIKEENLPNEEEKILIKNIARIIQTENCCMIIETMIKINNDSLIKILLNNLPDLSITESMFFESSNSKQIEFFQLLIDNQLFKNEYLQTSYFTIANKILSLIKNFFNEIDKQLIITFISIPSEYLSKRLNYIFNDEQEKAIIITQKIMKSIELYNEIGEALKIIIPFYHTFHQKKEEKIKLYIQINDELNNFSIGELNNNQDKYNEILKEKEAALPYKILMKSSFFMKIYQITEIENEDEKRKKATEIFANFEDLLIDSKSFFQKNQIYIKDLFNEPQGREYFEKEIKYIEEYFEDEIDDIESIICDFVLLNQRPLYLKKAKTVLFFLRELPTKITDFSKSLQIYISNLENNWNINDINKFNSDSHIISLQFDNTEMELPYIILDIIYANKDLLPFLKDLKIDDARQFNEFIYEVDNSVSKDTIKHFIDLVYFLNDLLKEKNIIDCVVIQRFLNKNNEIHLKIENAFKEVSNNLTSIKELHHKIVNKDESHKEIITKLFNNSIFQIKKRKKEYMCTVEKYTFDQIIELKDKTLLLAQNNDDQKDKDEKSFLEICKSFALIIDKINALYLNVVQLYNKGYPINFELNITVKQNDVKVDNEQTLEQSLKKYQLIFNDFINEQIKAYQKYEYMSFIYGKQFNYMFNFIKNECPIKQRLTHFLNYLSNNQLKTMIKFKYQKQSDEFCQDMLININNFIINLTQKNDITLHTLYSKNIIQTTLNYQGIYLLQTLSEDFEISIIGWYQALTQNNPIASTILFCNNSTSIDEIVAFIYRAILCEKNVLFFFVQLDTLDLEKSTKVSSLLVELFENDYKMKSSLFFLYSNKGCELITFVKKLKGTQSITNIDISHLTCIISNTLIEVIHSDASGVGKSKQIELQIKNSGKKYIYFPIGGEFSKKRILKRLKKVKFEKSKTGLHLDLMDTSQIIQMREFLFSFLITKYYHYHESIFFLCDDIEIKIEIPYGFINFLEKFPFLKLFKSTQISIQKMNPLIVPQNPFSNIQIVCNYLINSKYLDHKDIFIPYHNLFQSSTSIPVKILSQNKCQELIKETLKITNPTYYQISSFIDILASQLKSFSQSLYINISILKENGEAKKQDIFSIRPFILESLIKITTYFTEGAYSTLIKQQTITHKNKFGGYDEKQDISEAILKLSQKDPISFDKIKPSLVFFNEDLQSIGIITTESKETMEYIKLKMLLNSSREDNNLELSNFKTMTNLQFLYEVKKVLNLKNCVRSEEAHKINSKLKSIEDIIGSYVFTADNYIKMILILLRIRAKIPVIMMGETGCGKTSLIKMISELLNNRMKILNIHAEIDDNDIIAFVSSINSNLNPNETHNIWVFFDEINTCHSMGLISEIISKHTMEGIELSDRMIFFAACNPYRLSKKEVVQIGLVKDKGEAVRNLVYNVLPLPHSLLNFVFDFGSLKSEDEKRYIESMIVNPITKSYEKDKLEPDKTLINQAIESIMFSQNFIRENNDISSVSLREVRRMMIFFEWFIEFLHQIKETSKKTAVQQSDITQYQLNGIILSIYICYYLRLVNKELRKKFREEINIIFKDKNKDLKIDLLIAIPEFIQQEIVERIKLPKGIAKNRALKENLFTLFVCVNNKIPVFIVGKPGSSKTLSVQLLNSALRGDCSEDPLFQKLPRIHMNNYQGSLTSTSKGVLSVFHKAREVLKNQKNRNIISMVFFDEMGLAEISKNNPLKVIHSQLEYDDNEDKIAFVGISNWILDASKMNRGIFLSIPETDEEDLIETAQSIALSYNQSLIANKELFSSLAKAYFKYKATLLENYKNLTDYHGSRDFYHLIKNAARNLKIAYNPNVNQITKECIERNFGGTDFSIQIFKEIYSKQINKNHDIMKCVSNNLIDEDSRYLIIISKASISHFLLDSILKQINKSYSFYIGSQFPKDINEEYYSVKIINKIQHCMQQDRILALKNLDFIYPSLYDLFNQNFTCYSEKSYARIAFGTTNSPLALVHNKFRCVILLDQKEIEQQDPPFLNRFEKQIVSFEYLLDEKLKNISKTIRDILKELVTDTSTNKTMKIKIQHQLINCDFDEIQGIAYMKSRSNFVDFNELTNNILQVIIPTFSQDIMAYMYFSNFKQSKNKYYNKIIEIYNQDNHSNLINYLKNTKHLKTVIYTFSSILDEIKIKEPVHTKIIGNISEKSIAEIVIAVLQSENEFESFLSDFYENNEKLLFIIRFSLSDISHMNHIKFVIENYENEREILQKKIFIFTIHLKREILECQLKNYLNNRDFISHLSSLYQIFIDNINGKDINILELFKKTTRELYEYEPLINIEQMYQNNLYCCYMKLKYDYINGTSEQEENCLIKLLSENKIIAKSLIDCLKKQFDNKENSIIQMIYNNLEEKHKNFEKFNKNEDFITNIIIYLEDIFQRQLTGLLLVLVKDSLIPSSFMIKLIDEDLIPLFNNAINDINLPNMKISMAEQGNEVQKIRGLNIPGSKDALEKIIKNVKTMKDEYYSNEDFLRKERIDEENTQEIDEVLNQFEKTKRQLIDIVYNEMLNIPFLFSFIKQDFPLKIIKYFINDYYVLYLSNHYKIYLPEAINFIEILSTLRFIEYQDAFENLSRNILWLESNETSISILINLFLKIYKYKPDSIGMILSSLENKEIDNDISSKIPKYKEKINIAFYIPFRVLINSIFNEESIIQQLNEETLYDYLKIFDNIVQDGRKLELNLWFTIKELVSLECFVEIFNCYTIKKLVSKENITVYLNKLHQEQELIKKKDEEKLILHLNDEYQFFFNQIGDLKDFNQTYIKILIGKYIQFSYDNYRTEILKIVLSNDSLLYESSQLLKYYFQKYQIEPIITEENTDLDEHFIDFKNSIDSSLLLLNNSNNEILEELLIFYFQKAINLILNNQNEDKSQLFQSPLQYLEISIHYIENLNMNTDHLKKLAMLYCISYIKVYLYYYVDLCYNRKDSIIEDFNSIDKIIVGNGNNPIRKVIKIYILKLFMQYMTYEKMSKCNFNHTYQISWTEEFEFYEKNSSHSILDFLFISHPKIDNKEKFQKIILGKDLNSKLVNENIMLFFDMSLNNILISHKSKEGYKSHEYNGLFDNSTINSSTKNLLSLLCNENKYQTQFLPSLKKIKLECGYIVIDYAYQV